MSEILINDPVNLRLYPKQKVLNLYGGPGCGKTTMSLDVCARLKHAGYNIELVREYAKEIVWEHGTVPQTISQEEILKEQDRRQRILIGKVDLIVTDSPLLLAALYGSSYSEAFRLYSDYDNYNVRVIRQKPYNPAGRYQSEDAAHALDESARAFTCRKEIPGTVSGGIELFEYAVSIIETKSHLGAFT